MNKRILLLPLLAASSFAQSAPDQPNPMSTWLRNAYTGNRNNIVRTAEKMPEENYGMRPGTQQDVRTFGQQVTHVAFFNYLWCSQAKGEKNPDPGGLDKLTSKAEILNVTQENGRQTRNLRMGLLTLNYAHNNEIYGSMVIYLRIKNLVPPASEPRPQQKK